MKLIQVYFFRAHGSGYLTESVKFTLRFSFTEFSKELLETEDANDGQSHKIFKTSLIFVVGALVALWLIFFVVPNNHYFLYSKLPGTWKNWLTYLLLGFLVEGRITIQYMCLFLMIMTYGFIYCQGTRFWLTQIRLEDDDE